MKPFSKLLSVWNTQAVFGVIVLTLIAYFSFGFGPVIGANPQFNAQLFLTRGAFILVMLLMVNYYINNPAVITDFFKEKDSPYPLAIFRILFFSFFVFGNLFFPELREIFIYPWVNMPKEKMDVLPIIGRLFHYFPHNEAFMLGVTQLWVIAAFTAFIGLFTRSSLLIFAILTFYILGIPQHFGKVSHDQHFFLWVVLIGLAPSGHVLSVDSLIRRWRKQPVLISRHIIYAIPMRMIWLTLAIFYFFPGFWKLWECGLDFAFSDNLKNQMLLKWVGLEGWRPIFRIDKFPMLCHLGGLFTLLFEIGFIFILFHKKFRKWLFLGALNLHLFILLFMKINFMQLLIPYVAIFDLSGIWRKKTTGNQPIKNSDFNVKTIFVTGAFFAVMLIYCGATKTHSWPFSSFPLFNAIQSPNYRFVDYKINNEDSFLDKSILNQIYPSYKLRAMEDRIILSYDSKGDINERNRNIKIITDALKDNYQEAIDSVQIHINLKPVDPDQYHIIFENTRITTIHYQ